METSLQDQFIDTQTIKRKSFFGVVALTSRTFVLQIISLVSTFILTILLDPESFGIFFIVTAVVNFLNYFSDIGLAAALIQKKEEPTRVDLVTTFTIQQILVVSAVFIALFSSSWVARFYGFDESGLFLFRALAISFMLSSLKTIPSVLLERKLEFQKLVPSQIVETTSFYITAILLAWLGFGVASFAWAALVRGITGTITLYLIAPWRPGFNLNKKSAKSLLKFGLPFQTNSFLALMKDDLLTVFLGKILPFAQVGYIGWAKKWAEIALRLIMDNIIRVTFPTYARLQHDHKLLAKAIEKSLLFLALFTFPIAIGMMFVVRPLIDFLPRYIKWEPALFSFYLFTISAILATLSSPLVNALNALGKVKYTFYLMVMWTTLTWALIPVFISYFGFNGVAIASLLIGLTSFVPLYFLRKVTQFSFLKQMMRPGLATLCMGVVLFIVMALIHESKLQIMLSIGLGIITYSIATYILMGSELRQYMSLLKTRNV